MKLLLGKISLSQKSQCQWKSLGESPWVKVPGTFTGTFTATSQSPKDWPSMCTDGYIPVYTGIYYVQTGICQYIPYIVCTDLYRSVYTGYTLYRLVYTNFYCYIFRYTVMCRISWNTSRFNDASAFHCSRAWGLGPWGGGSQSMPSGSRWRGVFCGTGCCSYGGGNQQ